MAGRRLSAPAPSVTPAEILAPFPAEVRSLAEEVSGFIREAVRDLNGATR